MNLNAPTLCLALFLLPACQEREDPMPVLVAALEKGLSQLDPTDLHALGNDHFQAVITPATFRVQFIQVQKHAGKEWTFDVDPEGWTIPIGGHLLRAVGEKASAVFTVRFDGDGRLASLFYQWEAPVRDLPEMVQELESWKGDWGVAVQLLEPDGATGEVFGMVKGREAFPLGSIFKVYVLAEVARRIGAGDLEWDDKITVEDRYKSLPSGITQKDPAGLKHTVETMVKRMIRLSDNTTTDHLLFKVGREAVEERLEECFNSVPERNRPFLSTMEMFTLKGLPEGAVAFGGRLKPLAQAWSTATPEEKRGWLNAANEAVAGKTPDELRGGAMWGYQLRTLSTPEHVEMEWLAHPGDIARLYLAAEKKELFSVQASEAFLKGLGYGAALYVGPGVDYHGFKGGNETSVLAFSLLVKLDDGTAVAACVCRSGFPALDPTVTVKTTALFNGLVRAALEDRIPAQSEASPVR